MDESEGDFDRLPEACISHVLSLTSPPDACRSAAVSAALRAAVDSDTVWERFLPPDYSEILDRAVDPIEYSSKRDLFFRLCDPILIDGGTMSFQLDKSSGAKCYMISARSLSIIEVDTPGFWEWISVADSSLDARFSEVAHLLSDCWLEIHGKIESRILSPKTNYAAYLVYKLDALSRGLSIPEQEVSVKVGAHESTHTVRLQVCTELAGGHPGLFHCYCCKRVNFVPSDQAEYTRVDGWMEIEMGEFFNDNGEDGEVDLSLMEVKGEHSKSGLTVLGIEVRPKY